MRIDFSQFATLFALSKRELRVLDALETPMSVAALSRTSRIVRTSLYPTLEKLKRRSLVISKSVGRRRVWQTIGSEAFFARIERIAAASPHRRKAPRGETQRNARVSVMTGVPALTEVYELLLELKKHERVLILQPNQSTEIVIRKLPYERMLAINRHIQSKKIIVEAIIHEDAIPHYFTTMLRSGLDREQLREMAEAVTERLAKTTYLAKDFLTVGSELYIIRDVAYLMNWDEEVGIRVADPGLVELLVRMFEFVRAQGKRVDQNPRLRELIGRRKG